MEGYENEKSPKPRPGCSRPQLEKWQTNEASEHEIIFIPAIPTVH